MQKKYFVIFNNYLNRSHMRCILMYSNFLQDARTMRQNFIINTLTPDLKSYKKLLPTNVKYYLSRIVGRDIK